MVRRLVPLVGIVLVGLVGLGACATQTNGQAVPEPANSPGVSTSARPSPGPSSDSPASGSSPLAGVDPCQLLDEAGKNKLGITAPGEPGKIGIARNCRWRVRGASNNQIFDLGVLETAGIADIPTRIKTTEIPDIGDHRAVKAENSIGAQGCSVILGVSESSRVDMAVVAGTDVQKACDLVMELAKQVEPKLP